MPNTICVPRGQPIPERHFSITFNNGFAVANDVERC